MRIRFNSKGGRQMMAGVTLIEALVAMGVFGITFFSLYGGMSMGISIIRDARENLRATQVMVEKMETIRLYSWDQITNTTFIPSTFSESYYPDGLSADSQSTYNGLVYSGTLRITGGPSGVAYGGDMRKVTVSVTWTSNGRSHNRTMSTYVARHGLQNYIY